MLDLDEHIALPTMYWIARSNATDSSTDLRSNSIAIPPPESNCCILNNPLAFLGDVVQHFFALIEDLAVGKANDRIAQFVQIRRAGLIVFDLLGVGIAIDFDAEFGFIAIEVDDESIDWMLSSKLEAIQLSIA